MARRLTFPEFITLASDVRLGIALGFFDIDLSTVSELIHTLADGNIISSAGCEDEPELAPKQRAEIIRSKLN